MDIATIQWVRAHASAVNAETMERTYMIPEHELQVDNTQPQPLKASMTVQAAGIAPTPLSHRPHVQEQR